MTNEGQSMSKSKTFSIIYWEPHPIYQWKFVPKEFRSLEEARSSKEREWLTPFQWVHFIQGGGGIAQEVVALLNKGKYTGQNLTMVPELRKKFAR